MQQALQYAEMIDVPFVYSTNSNGFMEHDRTGRSGVVEQKIGLDHFPSPETLWNRYCLWKGLDQDSHQDQKPPSRQVL